MKMLYILIPCHSATSLPSELWVGLKSVTSDSLSDQMWLSGGGVDPSGRGPGGSDLIWSFDGATENCVRLLGNELWDMDCDVSYDVACMAAECLTSEIGLFG